MSAEGIAFIRQNIHGLSVSGLWDEYHKSPIKSFLHKLYGNVLFAIVVIFNVSQFIEVFYVLDTANVLMQNLGVTFFYALILVKAGTILYRKKRFGVLLDKIRFGEERVFQRNEQEIKIYNGAIKWNSFQTNFFWTICSFAILATFVSRVVEYWISGPLKSHHYKVPFLFSSWFPFDKFSNGGYFLAYVFQIFIGSIGSLYTAVTDTFIISLMVFGIGQFKIIQSAIKNLHEGQAVNQGTDELACLNVYPQIVELIEHHIRTIEYITTLDNLISPIMFFKFVICSFMVCALGLEGIMSGPSVRLILSIQLVIEVLMQILNYYWHANEIMLESMNVGTAVAESQWYNFSPKAKKALFMMMLRAQKPSMLSVGGFYSMSLNTYLMILQATYSYLALFRKIYTRE